jgi:4-cresol dehydrogenase (hydroxylating)
MTDAKSPPGAPAGSSALAAAIEQWAAVVGPEHVRNDARALAGYTPSTSSRSTRPLAVLRPQSTEEVVRLVKIAAAFRLPLYPISRGKNWGYGDACAPTDGQVIVDLSRMDRIVEIDATLAYAVIEPGVTQQQLSEYLRERNVPLWMDCSGAGPDTSLVGNILERGFGHSPYGNRFQNVAGLQIVLASGEVLDTGFGHYPQAKTTYLFPYGVGPYLDGLFTQSNLGIITRLAIWLMPVTECINHFLCSVERHDDIGPVIDALRPLRLDGTLRSVVHLGNDLRVISSGQTYPLERARGRVPLPPDLRKALRLESGVGAWMVSGATFGTARQVSEARRAIRKALAGPGRKLTFLSERKLAGAEVVARVLGDSNLGRNLKAKIRIGQSLFDMNRGIPNGKFLAGSYWRRRGGLPPGFPQNADPAADNCGMMWVSPIIPMRGEDALKLHALIEPFFEKYGFDLFITLSMITERALGGVVTVAYDKEDAGETDRAHACYRALLGAVMDAGYIPYRVGIQSMADLDRGSGVFWNTVGAVKTALDPLGIIAPGRYQPTRPPAGEPSRQP